MTDTVDKAPAPPEQIKAIPVRHYGRWVAGAVVLALVALIGVAFSNAKINYSVIPDYVFDPDIVSGAWTTLYISVLAMVLGVVLGVILAVMRLSSNPVTSTVAWFYIWFFRGTPVLVQLLLWYNISLVFPILNLGFYKNEMNQVMTPVLTALLGLGLNEAAYMSEIVRAGIQSVDEGQTEASHALGMTQAQTLRRVILPQAMRVIVPPTGNEFINMLKTSALAYSVQLPELIKKATDISSTSLAVVEMYFVACIWYLILTTVFSIGQYYIERRYARGSSRNLPPTPLQRFRKNLRIFGSFRRPEVAR
ncbi:polar amino acid transport system permease protein [Streptomyces griseochromogenes]|uniref:ABC transporter permease n=1 Tax=Streptomyces griseochromogenes TaxID=68214 RepID=A0A1B1AS21_9ACTN|nr:amino acid ABC transporter permease [Streptomyces griseochromogenes]ANP49388.1 ABC transporter permease [Streptomyces griseochromogenes]MBP2053187.1 polar amino acid transport system permease protein [Streptomyces griseochromogenes]